MLVSASTRKKKLAICMSCIDFEAEKLRFVQFGSLPFLLYACKLYLCIYCDIHNPCRWPLVASR